MIVLLLRIIYLPFGLLNYLLGCATSVSFCHYIMGSSVIIFRLSIIAFIGAQMYQLDIKHDVEKGASNNLFVIIQIALTVAVAIFLSIKASRYLD